MEELNKGQQIKVREYRNRRIGDFLKELHLTEGRCTGIPKIQRSMRDNGSPEARFETDEERSYFLTTIPIHPELKPSETLQSTQLPPESTQLPPESTQLNLPEWPESLQKKLKSLSSRPGKDDLRAIIIELCKICPLSASELASILGKKSKKALVRDHLTPLRQKGKLQVDNPKEHAANQKYRGA
jgi:ATP-dependent DNA helicase RecG